MIMLSRTLGLGAADAIWSTETASVRTKPDHPISGYSPRSPKTKSPERCRGFSRGRRGRDQYFAPTGETKPQPFVFTLREKRTMSIVAPIFRPLAPGGEGPKPPTPSADDAWK